MDDFFNLHRFSRLFIKHIAEHYKTYFLSWAILIGVLSVINYYLLYVIDQPIELIAQLSMFGGFYVLTGAIFTSSVFADFGNKRKAISALTLPASNFEKFLVGWIWSYLLFSVIFIVSFYCVLSSFINTRHWASYHNEVFNFLSPKILLSLLFFGFFHAFALLGAIFFNDRHFIKTGFMFTILIAVFTVLNKVLLSFLLDGSVSLTTPFSNVEFLKNDGMHIINQPSSADLFMPWFFIAITVLLWVAAYYRLKEKQV